MPFQAPSWTEFYNCPICENEFSTNQRLPISLGCGHTICRVCLATVYNRQCPFDQTYISTDVDNLPINNALLQILNSGDGNDNGNEASNNSTSTNATTSNNNNSNTKNNANISYSNINSSNNNSSSNSGGNNNKTLNSNSENNEATAGDTEMPPSVRNLKPEDLKSYKYSKKCIEELAQYLKSFVTNSGCTLLTRPMLRKLVTLVNCQLVEEEGRIRAVRTSRFLGERTVTELLLQHQNPQQLSLCLWAAVRSRGCQFLGPSMQEEVLKLVLMALENGSALSRKVLVMYVVQRLVDKFLPASKTSIGHVVQLLYRASCFKVSKRDGDSSLMQLKEEFRDYEALRREHDAQIVQIATEAGLRIAPDQWSSLLYGNTSHKSHMQSICDTLQTPSSFSQSIQELVLALQRTGDPTNLSNIRSHLKHLANIDPSLEGPPPTWEDVEKALDAVRHVVLGLVKFMQFQSNRKVQDFPVPPVSANGKYKISLCRDYTERRMCPRGANCTFAHSAEERQRYRAKHRRTGTVEKIITRPATATSTAGVTAGASGSTQTLENIKKEFSPNPNSQQNQSVNTTHHNQTLGHLHTSPADMVNSPIKVKTSPMRKYANNENPNNNGNIMRPNLMDPQFVGDLSNTTSPLHIQGSINALHASPIPPGHMLGLTAPTPIVNVPPLHQQHPSYENIPFGALNFVGAGTGGAGGVGGKFVRMPTMGTNLPPPPHIRPPNLRGPISSTGSGGLQGLSPRSSMHNPINMTTVVNPPNLQGTNSNKPPTSPLHKNLYNNSNITGDFYNNVPSYFGNPTPERQLQKPPHMPAPTNPLWDSQQHQQQQQPPQQLQHQQHPQCQSLLKPSDYPHTNQHHLLFMPPSANQPNDSNVFFDKNSLDFNKTQQTSNLDEAVLQLNDNFMFKTTPNNFLEPNSGHPLKDLNKKSKPHMFWHTNQLPNNANYPNSVNLNSNNNNTGNPNSNNSNNNNNNNIHINNGVVNIEPPTSSSLFRDRECFVRSDSILDDDAATFDVPPTSTAALGNKYGPICPMYKGLNTSTSPNSTTNSFVGSWNALISPENDKQCSSTSNNPKDLSVFSLNNNDNALNMPFERHLTDSTDLTVPAMAAAASAQTSTAFDNFNNSVEAALSKLSLNFSNDSRNDQQQQHQQQLTHFEYDALDHILGVNNMGKNDELLWNNASVNNNNNNSNSSKQSTMNLGLNSFWSDSNTTAASQPVTQSSTATLMNNNLQLSQQQQQHHHQQQQRLSHKLDDTELDITEIVDKILPYADDSGIKLD
ncbi:roquin-2 [Lucilia cuprina]|uniref:roquin-2 n=1 Tax=Lucilia cuprina TaxID=7375 RepID=UPI001F0669EB|nr:roquin-2 [Lucilia cuprina]XP_046807880.1 roquin-2 [Lucilia cuprina]XP_046807881.1 roquin-2 [Lucilia cuprina]XP_046807882.1 roquin-2 [Lucilia cuprina]